MPIISDNEDKGRLTSLANDKGDDDDDDKDDEDSDLEVLSPPVASGSSNQIDKCIVYVNCHVFTFSCSLCAT